LPLTKLSKYKPLLVLTLYWLIVEQNSAVHYLWAFSFGIHCSDVQSTPMCRGISVRHNEDRHSTCDPVKSATLVVCYQGDPQYVYPQGLLYRQTTCHLIRTCPDVKQPYTHSCRLFLKHSLDKLKFRNV